LGFPLLQDAASYRVFLCQSHGPLVFFFSVLKLGTRRDCIALKIALVETRDQVTSIDCLRIDDGNLLDETTDLKTQFAESPGTDDGRISGRLQIRRCRKRKQLHRSNQRLSHFLVDIAATCSNRYQRNRQYRCQ
jgi:hypothetical protein